jgi:hypothetical protein
MTDFQTTADILFEADQDSLRSIRDEVESIGPLTVEYQPSPNPAARSAGRTDGGRGSVGGRQTRSILTDIRDLQEDTLIQLEDMADTMGGGGVGGGPLEVITGVIGDVGGEAAGATAETVGSVGGTAAGSALGTLAGELLAGTIGSGDGAPKPVPIASEDTPVAVEDATLDVETPTLDVDDPSPLTIDDTNLPLPVERVDPIPVDAPRSIPVRMPDSRAMRPADTTVRATATAISGGGGGERQRQSQRLRPLEQAAFRADQFGSRVPILGDIAGGIFGFSEEFATALPGGSPPGRPSPVLGLPAEPESQRTASSAGRGGGIDADINATRRSTITVDVSGVDRLKQDVIDEVERMHDQDIRELERELDKLRRALTG